MTSRKEPETAKIEKLDKSVIVRGLQLLEYLLEQSKSLSMRDLAQAFDSQPSTMHRTLSILEKSGYLVRDGGGGLTAGSKLLRLALLIVERADPEGLLHKKLAKVVEQTNETCVLFLVEHSACTEVFVSKVVNSLHPLQYRMQEGNSHAITVGASGLAALAFMPGSVQETLLAGPQKRYTNNTTMDADGLRHKLDHIRQLGYALTFGEHISGAVGIAVPVFDHSEQEPQVLGDICLTIPTGRFDETKVEQYVRVLKDASVGISNHFTTLRKYGHRIIR